MHKTETRPGETQGFRFTYLRSMNPRIRGLELEFRVRSFEFTKELRIQVHNVAECFRAALRRVVMIQL